MSFYDSMTTGISIPLTTLATGYKPQGLIGQQVFPVAKAPMRAAKIPVFNKDAFKIYNTLRAVRAYSNRGTISADSWISYSCEEHDLAIPLDRREIEELASLPVDSRGKALFNIQDRTRRRVQWNLAMEDENNVATIVQATANYSAGHYVTLTGTDQWDDGAGGSTGDPVDDIETARETIRSKIGIYPNMMIMGSDAYRVLKFHTSYTGKMKLTNDKVVRPDLIAAMHDLKKVIIGQSMGVDIDGNFVDLWGDNVIICYIPVNQFPDIDEPAFGYTIRPTFSSKPFPYVDIFTEEGGKLINIRCTDMYDQVMVNKDCGYIIKDVKK